LRSLSYNKLGPRPEEETRFFLWLLLQNGLWTADCLRNRRWNHNNNCCLCGQALEDANHLFLSCPFLKEVYCIVLSTELCQFRLNLLKVLLWWNNLQRDVPANWRKEFALIPCGSFGMKGTAVFFSKSFLPTLVAVRIREELDLFSVAPRV
jgi:hypothetical protein